MASSLPVDLSALQKHLHQTTSFAAALPVKSDLAFHRSVDPSLAVRLDEASGRVWELVDSLLGWVDNLNEGQKVAGAKSKRKREEDDLVENFEETVIAEGVDGLLERADTCLDTFLGRIKAPAIPIIPTETARSKNNLILPGTTAAATKPGRLPQALINAQIPKPQLLFPPPKVDNFSTAEFRVYSSSTTPGFVKHHAQVPVDYVAAAPEKDVAVVEPAEAINPDAAGSSSERREAAHRNVPPHPYTYELLHPMYPASLLAPKPCTPVPPASFADTAFTFIDTRAGLLALVETLEQQATHLAVDLEHHSTRTFAGFLCLAQMTARNGAGEVLGDWVIDLVVPQVREAMRDHMGRVLANPAIIKIFHGAESDIVWLQQNFDLFVVNMFDTYHATKVLEFPSHSLASLLELYCDFLADKRYQLADWRIRPMPQEMLDYARSDTHFLLFIFDHLLNGLISRSSPRSSPSLNMPPATPAGGSFAVDTPLLLQHVLARSAQTCLRRFAADIYDAEHGLGAAGWFSLAKKYNKLFLLDSAPGTPPAIEGAVYKRLHAWRDATAREEDESTAYVMKNHQLFILAGRKPTTVKELFLMGQQWSEVVRRRADELVDLIRTTTDEAEGAAGPTAAIPMEGIIASAAVAAPAPAKQMVVDVWGAVQEPSAASAAKAPAVASSSLFGPSISSRAAVVPENAVASSSRSYVAPSSSLFGAVGSRAYKMQAAAGSDMFASPSSSKGEAQEDAFLRVLGKINLSINPPPPPTPTAPVAAPAQFATVVVAADDIFALPGAEEVPFVPAASRASKPQPSADDRDAIVTVGRPKEKKRKRDKTADAVATGASAVDVKGKGREVSPPPAKVDDLTTPAALNAKVTGKPFDYSAVPNGLDQVVKQDNPNKLKKAKKVKKPVVQYGEFKRPPQSMAETKKGNKNMTFK